MASSYTGAKIAEVAKNVYLNRGGVSDLAILPVINVEYRSLQQILLDNDVPILNKVFSPITVAALAVSIPPGGAAGQLPLDFVEPIRLFERAVGGLITDYVKMVERRFLPRVTQGPELIYWAWQEESIKLIGATGSRQVQIEGIKTFDELADLQDTTNIPYADDYLAAAVGATCALTILQNPTQADAIRAIAYGKLADLLAKYARKNQSLPVRRLGMRRRGM